MSSVKQSFESVHRLTNGMSLEKQIGQLFVVGFDGLVPTPEIIDMIQNYHVGGIILFSRNVRDTKQLLKLNYDLQMVAKEAGYTFPLIITLDQENGVVQRLGGGSTVFPGNMALGAINTTESAFNIAEATGVELKALGINMNLAPVIDINNNPANPVIGVRSFGEDPNLVGRLGAAMVKGYHVASVISNLKHFPGHGDTPSDSHLDLPSVDSTMERLEDIELVPFKQCFQADADTVMIAHIHFPLFAPDERLPSTVSSAVIQGLLREKLGFEGVVISDCLEMEAVSGTIGVTKGAIMGLQAGLDLVLISHRYDRQRAAIEAVREAVKNEEISEKTILKATERVLALKSRFLSWNYFADNPEAATSLSPVIGSAEHQQLADRTYSLSTTLVRNDEGLVPLKLDPTERIVVVTQEREIFTMAEDRKYSPEFLGDTIRAYHQNVDHIALSGHLSDAEYEKLLSSIAEDDLVIMTTVNAHLEENQSETMRRLVASGRHVIGIAAGNPYDLIAFPELRTYIATYEYTEPAQASAVRLLFGKIPAKGHLPVSLPGLYSAGHGITTE